MAAALYNIQEIS